MRLFIALDIPDDIRQRIARFVDGVTGFAPDAKWVGPETFHITLKFIGDRSPEDAERIKQVLRTIKADPVTAAFRGYGFFPTANKARVFWTGIESDARLAQLASAVDEATCTLGIPRETAQFTPHLTLARARGSSPRGASGRPQPHSGDRPRSTFARVHEKLQALPSPEFGTMTATEFFLYESKLSPKGAHYTKLERFALGSAAQNSNSDA
jgi:RNA 2',3'-cyclic 3'-phosphodiesterase